MNAYNGPFDPSFELSKLSRAILAYLGREFMFNGHLFGRTLGPVVGRRFGEEVMREIERVQWASATPLTTLRLRRALDMQGDDMGAILKMLQVDSVFPPEYVKRGYKLVDDRHGYFWIEDCALLKDDPDRGWLTLITEVEAPGFDAVVAAVNPKARCRSIAPAQLPAVGGNVAYAWELVIDDTAEPRVFPGIVKPLLADELEKFPLS